MRNYPAIVVGIAAAILAAGLSAAEPRETDVFVSGQEGYHTYRIPSVIVTVKGTVLAFCEGRKTNSSDTGDIDLLMKRSTDGGRTWSKQQIVWDDGPNTCGNPCPVVDRQSGTIWLPMTHNLGIDNESRMVEQKGKGTRTVWLSKSTDDGLTWAKPVEITATTKKPNWTWYATGPGAGIQLQSGRLVVPCDAVEAGTKAFYSHLIYSDDHGATWKLGGSAGPAVNECEVVELADGSLLLNMRNYDRRQHSRAVATSRDGGLTWSAVGHQPALIEPVCQASIRRYSLAGVQGRNVILFLNPAQTKGRTTMTLRASFDEGKTWPASKLLWPGPAAYSCLAVRGDGAILCLYERGDRNAYERITLAETSLAWLEEK
jgi:sialidase-1